MSEYKKLREVGSIDTGFAFPSSSFSSLGVPVVRMSDLDDGSVDIENSARVLPAATKGLEKYKIAKGQFLFGLSGSLDAYGTYQDSRAAYLNQRVGRLCTVDPSKGDYNYIRHILSSEIYQRHAYLYGSGIAQLNISPSQVENLEFFCPLVPEQSLITRVLDTLDTQIQQTEALIAKLEKVKEGLLHDLLTRGIDENGQLRPSPEQAPELYQESPLGLIPKEWVIRPLKAYTSTDITYGIVQAGPHIEGGIPYIRTGDMAGDELSANELLCTSSRIASQYKRSELNPGDLVISIRATVGKVLPVPKELSGANLTQGTAKIAPSDGVDGSYLLWAIRSKAVRESIDLEVKGSTFKEITLAALREVPIAAPSNLFEQENIGRTLQDLDELLSKEKSGLEKLQLQKQGLMDGLLTGRVRVTPLLKQEA